MNEEKEQEPKQEYQFTRDWFNWAPAVWEQIIPVLPERKRFLEIGSYEGRSAVWIIEHMLEDGGELWCVDTWEGGEEHAGDDFKEVKKRFQHNIKLAGDRFPTRRCRPLQLTSSEAFIRLLGKEYKFDFIYIDGSHKAKDVLTDACMAWLLLKVGGVLVFDDYLWGPVGSLLHRPKFAIDAFTNVFADSLQFVHLGYQLIVKKAV